MTLDSFSVLNMQQCFLIFFCSVDNENNAQSFTQKFRECRRIHFNQFQLSECYCDHHLVKLMCQADKLPIASSLSIKFSVVIAVGKYTRKLRERECG